MTMGSFQSVPSEYIPRLQRYLPKHLWQDLRGGEVSPGFAHLQSVLRAVLTYVPRQIARARMADPGAQVISGQFVQVTIMFADISGFTAMSERLTRLGREGAEVITGIVNDYFATMLAIIARYDGDLFKFGGDALLVCFQGEKASARSCRTAIEMQAAMSRFALIETEQGAFDLRMKVGIGTGKLFFASLGGDDRLEFTVMGPALVDMALAEHLAMAGEIVIDQATCRAAGEDILVEESADGFCRLEAIKKDAIQQTIQPAGIPDKFPEDFSWLLERLDAISPYLPVSVLNRIVAAPTLVMIEGEHRLVTVLFANFYGIDELIGAIGPENVDEITTILNRHFSAVKEIVTQYGGIVNKVDSYAVGYRVMAIFGAPVAHEDDPANAVYAALEMQTLIKSFAELETRAGLFSLKGRTGVNTGYVFAGNLGSSWRQEYSVMGDEVNLAARLMGVAGEAEVLVSQATARHVSGLFDWEEREPVRVKGKSQPVRNFRVLGRALRQEERVTQQAGFFGRQTELALARSLVDAALQGNGAVLDLMGDAGVGKSRMVAELSDYSGARGMLTVRGEGVSYGMRIPYLPWIDVLRFLLGFRGDESQGSRQRRVRLMAGLSEFGLSEWAPIVGGVLGIEIKETPLTSSLDAEMRQQRFFDVVLQLIQSYASRKPLLLVLDDMYWADSVSLDLVTYVARNVATEPLLFIIIRRPGLETPPWGVGEHYHALHMVELDEGVSLELARAALGDVDPSPALRKLIVERAQGNPLFVEEVVRALSESGAVRLDSDQDGRPMWDIARDVSEVEVPTTLTSLIMSRIDRLEDTNRRLIQVAAVVGSTFSAAGLARVYPYGDLGGTLGTRLAELVSLDMTLFSPPDEYAFKHGLLQEVAYESLSFARRRELHVYVGEDIERQHLDDLAEYYGVLAHHYDEGRVYDKAFIYLVQAGKKAQAEFANQAALDHYRRAREIGGEVDLAVPEAASQVCDIWEAMGDINLLISQYDRAVEQFGEAMKHPACTTRRRADLLGKIAKTFEKRGRFDEAMEYLAMGRQVLSGREEDCYSLEMARICQLSGWVHSRRGDMEEAIADCNQGLAILAHVERKATALEEEAVLYNTLGNVYVDQGDYKRAAEAFQRNVDLCQRAGNLSMLPLSYNNLAKTAWAQGDLAGARVHLENSLEISQRIGYNYSLALLYNNLGVVAYTMGDVPGALEQYHKALSLRQRIGDSYGVAQTSSNLGEAYLRLEQYSQARSFLEQSASAFEGLDLEGELPEVYRLLAEVELAQGALDTALDYARRASSIAAATGNPEWQGVAERVLARIQAHHDDTQGAVQAFEKSIVLLKKAGNQVELARSHSEYGLLLAEQCGKVNLAREHLQKAIDLFTTAGAAKDAAQALSVMARLEGG